MNERTLLVFFVTLQAFCATIPSTAQCETGSQLGIADLLEHYEASLHQMGHARFQFQTTVFFQGGPYSKETKIGTLSGHCVRDGARWKIDSDRSDTSRINGEFLEMRVRQQDLGTDAGMILIWDYPAREKWAEKFSISARLADEAPPARSDEQQVEHYGEVDKFASTPWPTDLGKAGFIFGYIHFDGTSRLSKVLKDSAAHIVDASASDGNRTGLVLVEARGKFGRHRVWFDPQAGFLPRRVEVEKTGADIFGIGTVATLGPHRYPDSFWPDLPVERVLISIRDVEIKQIGKDFWIVGFPYTLTRYHPGGIVASERTEVVISNVEPDPLYSSSDFDVTLPIPNGTQVNMLGVPQISYEWRDGRIVKSLDQVADSELSGHGFSRRGGVWLLIGANVIAAVLLGLGVLWRRRANRRITEHT